MVGAERRLSRLVRIRRRHFFGIGKCRGSEIVVEVLLFLQSADPAVKKTASREREVSVSVPRFRVSARIVDGHIQFHRIFVDALITLDQVKLLGRGMPHLVEPYLPIESDRVHNERVSILIVADRIAPPGWIRIVRMVPVHPYGPPIRPKLVK